MILQKFLLFAFCYGIIPIISYYTQHYFAKLKKNRFQFVSDRPFTLGKDFLLCHEHYFLFHFNIVKL